MKLFNRFHAHRRARIERLLSYFCRHSFCRETHHRTGFITMGVHSIFLAELERITNEGLSQRYATCKPRVDHVGHQPCVCGLRKRTDEEQRTWVQYRDLIADELMADEAAVREEIKPRPPAHAKKQRLEEAPDAVGNGLDHDGDREVSDEEQDEDGDDSDSA